MILARRVVLAAALAAAVHLVAGESAMAQTRLVEIQVANYPESIAASAAPWVVARENGYFKDLGIDLVIRGSVGGAADVRALVAGGLPFVETGIPAVITAIQQGADIKIVSENIGSFASTIWFVPAASSLKSVQDLKGHKLGYSTPQSAIQMIAIGLLKKLGYTTDDVKMVAAGAISAQLTMLEGGGIDAITASAQLFHAAPEGKYRVIGRASELLPSIANSVGITTGKDLRENGDLIRKLIAGRRKGVDFLKSHPDEAIAILARAAKTTPDEIGKTVRDVVNTDYWSTGQFTPSSMDNLVSGLRDIGVINGTLDWRSMVDQQLLPDDLKSKL